MYWENRYSDKRNPIDDFNIKENDDTNAYFDRKLTSLFKRFISNLDLSVLEELELYTETKNLPLIWKARAFSFQAHTNDFLGDYQAALTKINQAINYLSNTSFFNDLSDFFSIKATIHSRMKEYEIAIEYYNKSLSLKKKYSSQESIASTLNQIARVNLLMHDFEAAENYYQECLKLRNEINDTIGIPWTYLGLGTTYRFQKKLEKSLDFLNLALKKTGDKRHKLTVLIELIQSFIHVNKIQNAKNTAFSALELAEELKSKPNQKTILELLSEITEKESDFKSSLNYLKKSKEVASEILSEEKQLQISRLEITHKTKELKQQKEIEFLKNVELAKALKEIHDSINYAQRIQEAILPSYNKWQQLLPNSLVYFNPKEAVSGDFTFLENHNNNLFFAVADCTGHGVPGALVSLVCHNALNKAIKEYNLVTPSDILTKTSELVKKAFQNSSDEIKDGMDISFVTKSNNNWFWSGANNPLYIISKNEKKNTKSTILYNNLWLNEIAPTKKPIGLSDIHLDFVTQPLDLLKGDYLVLFSDGFADQFGGPNSKKFKYKPFKQLLLDSIHLDFNEMKNKIQHAFNSWKGDLEQIDDVTVLITKIS